MEINLFGDLFKDKLGNYYVAVDRFQNNLTLVNAVHFFASNFIIDEEYCKEHENEIVSCFPVEELQNHIERVTMQDSDASNKLPLKLYLLESLLEEFEVVVDPFYERDTSE